MSTRRPDRIGRYEVLDRLGVGGMGAVYLASDPLLGRTVAIKVLRSDDEELRERFAREARSAAALKHPHIVTIYDIGEDDEARPFLAMEYIDGESMAEMIRRRAPIPLPQRLKYIIDLCTGLGYAHRAGIVHRDIKPANLMITSEGVLKIVDFGLARIAASSTGLTQAGTIMGTVHYMSPEQTEGAAADHLSDIFAVGLVLYEILAYRKAYPGESAPVVLHNIVHTTPPAVGQFLPARDEELESVVVKAIEKTRDRRYQDLRELASALQPVRARLEADQGAIVQSSAEDGPAETEFSLNALSPSPRFPSADPRHLRQLEVIAQRRAAQIAQRLAAAHEDFDAGRYEAAVEHCEAAILIDPNESRAVQLLAQAQQALGDREINQWVEGAKAHLSRGALTQAEELVERALELRSDSAEAIGLRNQVRQARRERERAADRARAVAAALDRARRSLQAGALEAAVRAATEALAYDPAQREASDLRDQAVAGLEARRQQQEIEQAAVNVTSRARELADAGDHSAAVQLLRAFPSPHPTVAEAIAEIEARIAALEQQRREEAERARIRALEEARRREQLALVRAATSAALDRGDFAAARDALRSARSQPGVPGDADLERLCTELETAIAAAEAAARLRASIDRHLKSAHAAIAAGDLAAAGKSVDAALGLAPDDAEARRLQRQIRELEKAATAAELAAQRRAAMERQIKAAKSALANGDLGAAAKWVDLTLGVAPAEAAALSLQQEIRQALEARQRAEQQRREAAEATARARELFAAARPGDAIRRLAAFEPHALVAAVEQELRDEQERLERQERERQERERQAREREERARLERERQERERHERERQARERQEREAAAAAETQARARPDLRPIALEDTQLVEPRASAAAADQTRARFIAPVAAAVLLALVAGGSWWAWRQRTAESSARVETPPVPVSVSYAKDLAAAREQFQNGDLPGAVRRALAIPSDAPESNEVTLLLREIRGAAQTRSQNARLSAERNGQANDASFSEATARDATAANLTRPEDLERVVSLYEEAASLYRKAAMAGASVAQLLQLARTELQASNMPAAVAYAVQVLQTNPRNAEALGLLRSTREQGQKVAQAAAAEARRAGASSGNSAVFKEAAAQESAAARITAPQQTLRAYDGFLSAAQRYREASEQFKADTGKRVADARGAREQAEQRLQSGDLDGAAAAIQQAERLEPDAASLPLLRKRLAAALAASKNAAASDEVEPALAAAGKLPDDLEALKVLADLAARYPNDARIAAALRTRRQARDARIADLVRRAQPAAEAQALELLEEALRLDPSRQDVLAERDRRRAAINAARTERETRNVVLQLEAAYESGNVAEIVRLLPGMDRRAVDAQFKSARITWDVEPCAVRVDPGGTTANLSCVIRETLEPIGIRAPAQVTTRTRNFAMAYADGTWRITAQQIQ